MCLPLPLLFNLAQHASGSFNDGQYVPTLELEGFSEDRDKDGFVDPHPSNGQVPVRPDRPRAGPAAQAPPQFASVDFRGVPQQQQAFQQQPAFQQAPVDRPQFPQEAPTRFLPQPQQQPQFVSSDGQQFDQQQGAFQQQPDAGAFF